VIFFWVVILLFLGYLSVWVAREKGIFEVAFPGMGTGVAAYVMVCGIPGFVSKNEGFRVVLVGFDEGLYGCFLGELSS